MPITPTPIPMTCTATELVVHLSLLELGRHPDVLPRVPGVIERWLNDHGLDISDVAIPKQLLESGAHIVATAGGQGA